MLSFFVYLRHNLFYTNVIIGFFFSENKSCITEYLNILYKIYVYIEIINEWKTEKMQFLKKYKLMTP